MELLDYVPKIISKIEKDPTDLQAYGDAFGIINDIRGQFPAECLGHTLALRKLVVERLSRASDSGLVQVAHDLFKQSLFLAARDDLDSYMQYIEWNIPYDKKFYLPRRRILSKILVPHLMDLENRKIDFLGISMPPRTGKSRSCKEFMSWHMGRHPDSSNAMCGYSGSLAQGFYDDILELVSSPDYLFKDVFPDSPFVHKSAEYLQINLLKKKTYATLTCRGVGGTWTGAVNVSGDGILYCDDLIEDEEEASSLQRLESKFSAYVNHVQERKEDGAQELMVGTRWNVYDPIGRLAEMYADDPKYRFVVLPALGEDGQSNFQYDRNGFSTEYYEKQRAITSDVFWSAKYIGQPYLREGLLYKPEELRRFYELPDVEPDAIISVCDTKDGGKDFFSSPIGYIYGQDCFIVDCICDDGLPDVVKPRLANKYLSHKVQQVRFESNAAGGEIAKDVQRRIKEKNGRTNVTSAFTSKNKETKILVNADWVKEHCLFWDKDKYPNEDYRRMIGFLTSYSVSGKNPHDDVPDSMAMLAMFAANYGGNKVEIFSRPF